MKSNTFLFHRKIGGGGGGGKMSTVGQSRLLDIFICMLKIKEPMVMRSLNLFSHWNRKSETDDPVILSSLDFTPETRMSSDSLCPAMLILPQTALHI